MSSTAVQAALLLTAALVVLELSSRGRLTRMAWHALASLSAWLELAALALVRLVQRPRYVLLGDCHKCSACCRAIAGDPPGFVKRSPFLLRVFIAYHRAAHGFEAYARGPDGEVVFRCGHLRIDGSCGIYWRRPFICRNYPLRPLYEAPRLLPDCSYRVAHRGVAHARRRPALRILNEHVAVHHPTPDRPSELGLPEHYELVDLSDEAPRHNLAPAAADKALAQE